VFASRRSRSPSTESVIDSSKRGFGSSESVIESTRSRFFRRTSDIFTPAVDIDRRRSVIQ